MTALVRVDYSFRNKGAEEWSAICREHREQHKFDTEHDAERWAAAHNRNHHSTIRDRRIKPSMVHD